MCLILFMGAKVILSRGKKEEFSKFERIIINSAL
jgi:hypothetical protein